MANAKLNYANNKSKSHSNCEEEKDSEKLLGMELARLCACPARDLCLFPPPEMTWLHYTCTILTKRESYSLVFKQFQVAGAEHIKEGRVDTLSQTLLTAQAAPVNSLKINNV